MFETYYEEEKNQTEESKPIYELADSLVECLYITNAELANTGDSF